LFDFKIKKFDLKLKGLTPVAAAPGWHSRPSPSWAVPEALRHRAPAWPAGRRIAAQMTDLTFGL